MPISFIKWKPRNLLHLICRYISSEGHYSVVFVYHIHLFMAFQTWKHNFPYFLLKGLKRTSKAYQGKHKNPKNSIFHHGLIYILVSYHLAKMCDDWVLLYHDLKIIILTQLRMNPWLGKPKQAPWLPPDSCPWHAKVPTRQCPPHLSLPCQRWMLALMLFLSRIW